ncbi:MAG: 50S ribosomal protein L17 [Desulfobacterales bacterium]|nr:50S ribosomal protein L17 [Desulfobacterales bacterium]MBF0396471.1 50S ribosomal protein L17 [Desulfobacterales bacterium]
MRHGKAGVKLNRTTEHREAMFKNMVTSLFKYDRIRTTDVKAKELRRLSDNLITLAKKGDLHARRQVLSIIREKDVVKKLFAEVEDRYGSLKGGYTRITKIGTRHGDAAPMSLVELAFIEKSKKIESKKTNDKKKDEKNPEKLASDKSEVKEETKETKEVSVAKEASTSPSIPQEGATS